MNKVTIEVTFLQGETTIIKDKPFLEAVQSVFSEKFEKLVPVKIKFPKTGKILFADKTYFMQFIEGKISTEHLINSCQCDGLYRNVEDVIIGNYDFGVDAGSLWMKKDKVCLLVNDDEYITYFYNEEEFKEV